MFIVEATIVAFRSAKVALVFAALIELSRIGGEFMIVAFSSAKVALVFAAFSELSRSERRLFQNLKKDSGGRREYLWRILPI